jgi:predicted glycoside hydrolase/deacetylase ChbG (UPF0249 family)
MAPRLIINADDFGLTPGVNRAIAELHQAKALTSATLMATGAAFEDAVAIAHANPTLGVGCHIVLTDGVPVSPPERIPTLIGPDRKTFRPSLLNFVFDLLSGRIREGDIVRETFAQIHRLQQAGIDVTHLDTHKHTHLFPAVASSLLHVAERSSIRAIRYPFEQSWSLALDHGNRIRRLQVKLLGKLKTSFEHQPQIQNQQVLTTDATIGISATGNLYSKTLHEIKPSPPRAPSSSAAIPATTTATSTASPLAYAPIATSSATPCSPKSPRSPCIQMPHNSSTTETWKVDMKATQLAPRQLP